MEKTTKKIFEAGTPEKIEKGTTANVEKDASSMEKTGKAKEVSSFSSFAESYKAALIEKVRNFENREMLHMFHEIRKDAISNGFFDKKDFSKIKDYTRNFTAKFVESKDEEEESDIIEKVTITTPRGCKSYKIVKVDDFDMKDVITSVNYLSRAGVIRFGEKRELSEEDKIKVNTLVNTLKSVPETSWDKICEICKFGTRIKNAAYEILKAQ